MIFRFELLWIYLWGHLKSTIYNHLPKKKIRWFESKQREIQKILKFSKKVQIDFSAENGYINKKNKAF